MRRIPLGDMTPADLIELHERLDRAEAVTDRVTEAARSVRRALDSLPERCRYHGDRLDPDHLSWGREACCDTGAPALHRRKALEALDRLTIPRLDTPPDTPPDRADTRGGIVRSGVLIGETTYCGPFPTCADTARTPPDTAGPDSPEGVRFDYRATVPRYLMGAAIADALGALTVETRADTTRTPRDTDTPDTVRTDTGRSARRAQTRAAICEAFDVPAGHPVFGHPDNPRPDTGRTPEEQDTAGSTPATPEGADLACQRRGLVATMGAVSQDRWGTWWADDLDHRLYREGGIWEAAGRSIGWPTGPFARWNWATWNWATWDEAGALYAARHDAGTSPDIEQK